jgi:hypothetical protein
MDTDDSYWWRKMGESDATDRDHERRRRVAQAARRALAETAERKLADSTKCGPQEVEGRGGLDPVRYGDWEVKGMISDF